MNRTETLEEMRRLERSRVLWKWIRRCSIGVGALILLTAFAIAAAVFIIPKDSALYESFQIVSVFSPVIGALGVAAGIVVNEASKKQRRKVDARFDQKTYLFLIRHLRRAGIKDPLEFLVMNEDSISAFQRIYNHSRDVVEPPPEYKGKRDDLSDCKLYEATEREAHRIAALVLPGERELRREEQVRRLLEERGYTDYASIKAMMDHTDDQPAALNDGAL